MSGALHTRTAGLDKTLFLLIPATLFMLLVFIYPFVYGLILSFTPTEGGWLANYIKFFTTNNQWSTIGTTLKLALPATIINVGLALPIAYQMRRKSRYQKWVTTILVIPITLGTVLIAEGMLTYFGPRGWLSQTLQFFHLYEGPIRLTHNYWGVLISLIISGFPFVFLLVLSYITGIDPVLAPGILAAGLLVLVRTIAMFELTFLTAGPDSQTLVVALYYAVFAAGVRAPQSVDAMAMVYMVVTLVWLLIALQFVNPTQLVSRVKEQPQGT